MIKLGGLIDLEPQWLNEAEDDKYVSIGFGRFKEKGKEDDEDAPTFKKDDSGKYIPTSDKAAKGGDSSAGEKDKPKVNIFDKPKKDEPKKDEPKDSANSRPGNPQVNKVVRKKAQSLGITPQKLGKEEYESRMSKAAVEALTDANFHSEARKLIAVLEDKPEWANDPRKDPKMPDIMSPEYEKWQKTSVYYTTFYDSAEGTDDLAHSATGESGWDGVAALDAIAYDLKMNGSKKLAAKLQGIIDDTNESSTKLKDLIDRR